MNITQTYNLFLSYSSAYRSQIAQPLYIELARMGVSVWYDEFELSIGDGLRKSIDRGISRSEYGLVIVSPDFFSKQWTEYEYGAFHARQMSGRKSIIPVLYEVSHGDLLEMAPGLADLVYLSAKEHSLDALARKIARYLQGDNIDMALWDKYYQIGSIHNLSAFQFDPDGTARIALGATGHIEAGVAVDLKSVSVCSVDSKRKRVHFEQYTPFKASWEGIDSKYLNKTCVGRVIEIQEKSARVELEPYVIATLPCELIDWEDASAASLLAISTGDLIEVYIELIEIKKRIVIASRLRIIGDPGYATAKERLKIGAVVDLRVKARGPFERLVIEDRVSCNIVCCTLYGTEAKAKYFHEMSLDARVIGFDDSTRSVLLGTYLQADSSSWQEHSVEIVVGGRCGIEALVGARLTKLASFYRCQITYHYESARGTRTAFGHSLMSVMKMAVPSGRRLIIRARGIEAEKALSHIVEFNSLIPPGYWSGPGLPTVERR